ncbi:MAG: copper chaperone PCu(A)C [Gammaproteobacteria bacterium]
MPPILLFLLSILLVVPPASAAVVLESPWLRESAPNQPNAASYLRLRNAGAAPVVLKGARVEGAKSAAVHEHRSEGGMMRMGEAPAQTIAPGAGLAFEPGGLHLMVFGLQAPAKAGSELPFCLDFEGAEPVCARARVVPLGGHAHEH